MTNQQTLKNLEQELQQFNLKVKNNAPRSVTSPYLNTVTQNTIHSALKLPQLTVSMRLKHLLNPDDVHLKYYKYNLSAKLHGVLGKTPVRNQHFLGNMVGIYYQYTINSALCNIFTCYKYHEKARICTVSGKKFIGIQLLMMHFDKILKDFSANFQDFFITRPNYRN